MSRISAKYNAAKAEYIDTPTAGGQVIGYANIEPVKTRVLDLSEGFRKTTFKKETRNTAFTVSLANAVHDLDGLRENGQETTGFETTKAIRRSAKLQFDTLADATNAHNFIVNMDKDALKEALKSQTLVALLAEELGLEASDAKSMKTPAAQIALFPKHFMAS